MLYYHKDDSNNVSFIAYVRHDDQSKYSQHSREIGMHLGDLSL